MPFMKNGKRDYKRELAWEKKATGSGRQDDRVDRNRARRQSGLKVGDPRHVDHVKPLTSGGSDKKSNTKIVSAKFNLTKEANRKRREARRK